MTLPSLTLEQLAALGLDLEAAVTAVVLLHAGKTGLPRAAVALECAVVVLDMGVTACATVGAREDMVVERVTRNYRAERARLTFVHGEA